MTKYSPAGHRPGLVFDETVGQYPLRRLARAWSSAARAQVLLQTLPLRRARRLLLRDAAYGDTGLPLRHLEHVNILLMLANSSPILTAAGARKRLAALASPEIARHSQRFFKTGPGQYGEGDRFRGIRLPDIRALARAGDKMSLGEVLRLLRSRYHEDRLLAVILMVALYKRGDDAMKRRVAEAYLANTRYINNWDIVDVSAAQVLGAHFAKNPAPLRRLARSDDLWERRMAVIASWYFIRKGECDLTLELVEQLLRDKHDLIHKACGWMLREVGRRCGADVLRSFLRTHVSRMPRTMLRYAIEHFSPAERRRFLDA